ncbi:endonuclease domain-containing protein [Oricola sp.]|uniref:endonuclease domain-containing protein n=1 Tax=Oricola sp. TaxID=1979950 RepID=UPI0025F67279|nr:endonuclease domain-containing protein [Oricola sp.]MCI5077371.1 endonuclease domain-containing protein [Oricola sp.]
MGKDVRRLRAFAREMRGNPTQAEERLWGALRNRRLDMLKFRRQVPIGPYIADFVCMEAKLIVEVDGTQHAESRRDSLRDTDLEARGFRVLRFWNDEVMRELDSVCATIIAFSRDASLRQDWR